MSVRGAIAVLGALVALAAPPARAAAPCSSAHAREFDFWLGDWEIRQKILRADGSWLELPARTSVSSTLDGCALIEHWRGEVQFFWEGMEKPERIEGLSVRSWDAGKQRWSIHWMDTRSPQFGEPYVGSFRAGRGEFFREFESGGEKRVGRISFSDIGPDSVDWSLAISRDGRKTWQPVWTMEMRRPKKGQ